MQQKGPRVSLCVVLARAVMSRVSKSHKDAARKKRKRPLRSRDPYCAQSPNRDWNSQSTIDTILLIEDVTADVTRSFGPDIGDFDWMVG